MGLDRSRAFLWLLLALPAAGIEAAYLADQVSYGQVIHLTGDIAVKLLILTLAVTPLRMLFRKAGWTRWLASRRREFGLAVFGYALFHLAAYLVRKADPGLILSEGAEPSLATGWLALLVFLPMAVTSNDAAVRRLGARWKPLHRLAYPAAALVFAHWFLEAFTYGEAIVHAAVLVALEAARLVMTLRRR